MTLLFCVETIFVAVQARAVQVNYIDNRNYPGGPWAYFLATQYLPVNVIFYAALFILTALADILVVSKIIISSTYYPNSHFSMSALALLGDLGWFGQLNSICSCCLPCVNDFGFFRSVCQLIPG